MGADGYVREIKTDVLHKKRCFKTDYDLQVAVESLYEIKFIDYVVFKASPETLTSKSINVPEIKPLFESVDYFESSNRLRITEKGLGYLQELRHDRFRYGIPVFISIIAIIVDIAILLG